IYLILSSCNTKFSLQKRRYTKGFFVSNNYEHSKVEVRALKTKLPSEVIQVSETKKNSSTQIPEFENKIITDSNEKKDFLPILKRINIISNFQIWKDPGSIKTYYPLLKKEEHKKSIDWLVVTVVVLIVLLVVFLILFLSGSIHLLF
ncbi:MAG TPA: hypothetical protein VN026_12990, partial [Bacteroidia bacterium]|nr:hypothetical protein [Bacteroidia bacterium]